MSSAYRIKVTIKERKAAFFVKIDSFEGDLDKVIPLILAKYGSSKLSIFDRLYKSLDISGEEFIRIFEQWKSLNNSTHKK